MATDSRPTVADFILAACARHRHGIAYTCMGAHLTYGELADSSARFCVWLRQFSGLRPGDRIGIQLPNLLQYPVVVLGALRAGLVVVNINPLYSPRELSIQLRDSGARALVVLANLAESASEVVADTDVEKVIVTEIADLHPSPKRQLINFAVRHVKKMVPDYQFKEEVSLRKALRSGNRLGGSNFASLRHQLSEHNDLALLQYTGGTTGISKGAMLTNASLLANVQQLSSRLGDECPAPGEVIVAPLPLYHIYAFEVGFLFALSKGLHSILIPNPRDISALIKAIEPYQIAGMVGINTLYNALATNKRFATLDFSSLKLCSAGGMALSSRTYERWLELTGCPITEGYGLTEASPLVSCNSSQAFQIGTVGVPVPGTDIRVVDASGRAVDIEEPGELWVKGPQLMAGYWHNPQETAEVLQDGWLRTGDIAVMQADGFLRIVDRLKDVMIVAGYNVYPSEIEDYVCQHPKVSEAAVVGVQRGENGDKVKLLVVAADKTLERQELLEYCRQGLANYKVPRLIEFRDNLPKTNVGKVLRRALKED
jgi:long-chain acyl-CoA synthetase